MGIGRTGRAGKPGFALSFFAPNDYNRPRFGQKTLFRCMLESDQPPPPFLLQEEAPQQAAAAASQKKKKKKKRTDSEATQSDREDCGALTKTLGRMLSVEGCEHSEMGGILNGHYVLAASLHHGRPVYKKTGCEVYL